MVQRKLAVVFPAATEGRWAQGRGKCREKQEGEGCREEHALGFVEVRGTRLAWFFRMDKL